LKKNERKLIIITIFMCFLTASLVFPGGYARAEYIDNQRCLTCHSFVPKGAMSTVETQLFNFNDVTELAHKNLSCLGCHEESKFSGPHPQAKVSANDINSLCIKCHEKTISGTHTKFKDHKLNCNDCHKVHTAFKKNLEYNNEYLISKKCAGCHETESVELTKCVHFNEERISKGDIPYCPTCHGEHTGEVKVEAAGLKTNLPMKGDCSRCHQSLPYSKSQKLETTSTNRDFHGIARDNDHESVSKCSSCHRPHNTNELLSLNIEPGTVPVSLHGTDLITNQCKSCHPSIDKTFENKKIHSSDNKCMMCHGNKGFSVKYGLGEKDLHIDKIILRNSVHGKLNCNDCHKGLSSIPHKPEEVKKVDCESCHQNDQKTGGKQPSAKFAEWKMSVHYKSIQKGGGGPTCKTCHGTHDVFPSSNPVSKSNYANIDKTCGLCHNKQKLEFEGSVHGESASKRRGDAPTCTVCHGTHLIASAKSTESSVSKGNIVKTCSSCHASVKMMAKYNVDSTKVQDYKNSFHGFATGQNFLSAATCDSCHGSHNIRASNDPKSSINPANIDKTCGKCHSGNHRVMTNMSKVHWNKEDPDYWMIKWISYFFIVVTILTFAMFAFYIVLDVNRWYKAKKLEEKKEKEGHGGDAKHEPQKVHKNKAKKALADNSGGETAPGTALISTDNSKEVNAIVDEKAGPSELFDAHEIIVDTMKPELFAEYNRTIPKHMHHKVKFLRWSENFRYQHVLLLTSSIILSITGMVQMFNKLSISEFYFKYILSVPTNAVIHRVAAVGLITFCIWHLLFIVFTRNGRFEIEHFIPNLHDLYTGIEDWVSLFCGRPKKCKFDRYTYLEKFDYFAAYWGCVLMIVTGAIMWGHNIIVSFMPMITVDIAKTLHGFEAILELVATMVFHIYMTHFNPRYFPMKKTFLDGMSDYEEMKEYHEKELERIFPDEKKVK